MSDLTMEQKLAECLDTLGVNGTEEFEELLERQDSYVNRSMNLPTEHAHALGWIEGAADALDMTAIEFVDAHTS